MQSNILYPSMALTYLGCWNVHFIQIFRIIRTEKHGLDGITQIGFVTWIRVKKTVIYKMINYYKGYIMNKAKNVERMTTYVKKVNALVEKKKQNRK